MSRTENELLDQMDQLLDVVLGSLAGGSGLPMREANSLITCIEQLGHIWKGRVEIPKRAAANLVDLAGTILTWTEQYPGDQGSTMVDYASQLQETISQALAD